MNKICNLHYLDGKIDRPTLGKTKHAQWCSKDLYKGGMVFIRPPIWREKKFKVYTFIYYFLSLTFLYYSNNNAKLVHRPISYSYYYHCLRFKIKRIYNISFENPF